MGLGELAGLAGILLAVLALLNEHDRRIWLAPWKPLTVRFLTTQAVIFLTYLATYSVWEGLDQKVHGIPFVWPWLVTNFEQRGWILDAKDWASVYALVLGFVAGLWSWLSPFRAWMAVRVLEERRIVSESNYIQTKLPGMLASSWPFSYWFRSRLASTFPGFMRDHQVLRHFLEFDPKTLIRILEVVGKRNRPELASATMQVLASHRTKAIDGALWNLYENDAMQRPEAQLFKAIGTHDTSSIWKRIHGILSTRNVGKGAWGSDLAFNGKTNLDILDTYAGRLGVSWIWLVRCSSLSSGFKDSSVEGYANSAVSMILKDLEGCSPILTPPLAKADRLLGGNTSGVIDPLRKTPGSGVRVAQTVTEWFLDEWIKRIEQAKEDEDRRLAIGSLFQFYRHILSTSALDELEKRALLTTSIDKLCAINLSDDDLRNFDDGLTPEVCRLLSPWLESKWYSNFGRTGNGCYWERLELLQTRYPR